MQRPFFPRPATSRRKTLRYPRCQGAALAWSSPEQQMREGADLAVQLADRLQEIATDGANKSSAT